MVSVYYIGNVLFGVYRYIFTAFRDIRAYAKLHYYKHWSKGELSEAEALEENISAVTMGKYNWEQRRSCLPGYATFKPSSPSLCLPLLQPLTPNAFWQSRESTSALAKSVCLCGTAYIQAHTMFCKLQKGCKCQVTGSPEVCGFVMFPSFIFFLWETEK